MKKILTFLISAIAIPAFGQVTLKSSGDIPSELFSSTNNKYERKKQEAIQNSLSEPRDVRLSRIRFYEQSYYMVDAIKNNANIYINDSYSKLINDIADDLLKDDPDIREKIHLYAYRAPYVNAFSTDQGDLFFTIGLLAHANNEAELAFIIGHEIIHFIEQHNITGFNERVKVAKGRGKYQDLDIDEGVERIHGFTRELEKEADLMAMDYFLKSDYDPNAAVTALQTLRTSHLGFEEQPFDYSIVLGKHYQLHKDLQPDSLPTLNEDTTQDEMSSHPHILARIGYCTEAIGKGKGAGTKKFIHISEADFKALQYLARKEQLIQLYDNHYYAKAIYNAAVLSNRDTGADKDWLQTFIDRSFKSSVEHRNGNNISQERIDNNYSGELYRTYHLLYKIRDYEVASILFIKTYYDYKDNPTIRNKDLTKESIYNMIRPMNSKWRRYEREEFDTAEIKDRSMDELLPALREIFYSDDFKNDFGDIKKYRRDLNKDDDDDDYDYYEEELVYQKPGRINADNILIYNPYYLRIDEAVEGYIDYQRSYDNEVKLLNAIEDAAVANDITTTILDVRRLEKNEGDKFDDIATLKAYINRFASKSIDDATEIMPASDKAIDALREKYNTDYVMWIGTRSYKGTSFKDKSKLLLNMIMLNFLPYSVLSTFEKDHQVELFYVVFDMKNNKIHRFDGIDVEYMKDNQNLLTIYLNALFKEL